MATKRYKFLNRGFKSVNGSCKWRIGKWNKFDGKLELCESGFHCSKRIYDAFNYVRGEILAEVEVRGKSIKRDDKEVWSEMRVVKAWKWQKKDSVLLAIYVAKLLLPNFEKKFPNDKGPREAIEAAKRYLKTGSKKGLESAESAAWLAESAESASAAMAVRSALVKKIYTWMDKRLSELEEIK